MVTFCRRFVAWGLLLALVGCGGGDKTQPAAQGEAGPGQMPADMMAGGAGGPPQAAAAPAAPAPPAKPAYEGPDPIQLLPPSLKQALGVRLGAISNPSHRLNKVLFDQFQPITTLLSRTGIKPEQIESVWIGSSRETNDVLLCVRTTNKFSPEAVRKALQAETQHDKIGKAEIFKLPEHPLHQNAVGFLDAQTFLLGRLTTVSEALKNPKAGSIRLGLEAANASRALFWLSQDPAELRQEITRNAPDAVSGLLAQALLPKGFAVAVAPASADTAAGTSPGESGSPGGFAGGPPAGAGGSPAGFAGAPPAGAGGSPAGLAGAPPAGAGGPPAGFAGAPPAGAGGPPAGFAGGPPAGENPPDSTSPASANSFELVVGVSFDSETTADAVEKQIKTALQLVQQSGNQVGGFAAGGADFAPPGGGQLNPPAGVGAAGGAIPPGVGPPAGVGGRRPAGVGAAGGAIPPGVGPPAGVGGRPPGAAPPAGAAANNPQPPGPGAEPMPPNADAGAAAGGIPISGFSFPGGGAAPDAVSQMMMSMLSSINVTRDKEKLRVTAPLPIPENAGPVPLVGLVLQTAGASAVGDGLFEGSLDLLARGMQKWGIATPDGAKGVLRVGQLPLRSGYSWMTHLLPYIGRDDVYSQFDFKKSWDDPKNRLLASQVIPEFLNPTDSRTIWTGTQYTGLGLSHFVGMSGVEDTPDVIAATLNRSDPRAGVFGYDRNARPNEITDGPSQTIMMIGSGGLASPWVMGGGATVRGARSPYIDDLRGFGSRGLPKPGTFAVFADGSVRIISADIDPAVFKAMCTIHGNDKAE